MLVSATESHRCGSSVRCPGQYTIETRLLVHDHVPPLVGPSTTVHVELRRDEDAGLQPVCRKVQQPQRYLCTRTTVYFVRTTTVTITVSTTTTTIITFTDYYYCYY